MTVDLNDPETKKQIDAFVEHEKHEPLPERIEDFSNRRSPLAWGGWTVLAIVVFGALVRFVHC